MFDSMASVLLFGRQILIDDLERLDYFTEYHPLMLVLLTLDCHFLAVVKSAW